MASAKRKKNLDTASFYVDPKKLTEDIQKYYDTDDPDIESSICEDLKKIAEKLSYSPSFLRYSYREDMVGDALLKMYTALRNKNFDPSKGTSPFSYFTTTAYRAFINRIKKEKKEQETVEAYREDQYEKLMTEEGSHIYSRPEQDEDEMFDESKA